MGGKGFTDCNISCECRFIMWNLENEVEDDNHHFRLDDDKSTIKILSLKWHMLAWIWKKKLSLSFQNSGFMSVKCSVAKWNKH